MTLLLYILKMFKMCIYVYIYLLDALECITINNNNIWYNCLLKLLFYYIYINYIYIYIYICKVNWWIWCACVLYYSRLSLFSIVNGFINYIATRNSIVCIVIYSIICTWKKDENNWWWKIWKKCCRPVKNLKNIVGILAWTQAW